MPKFLGVFLALSVVVASLSGCTETRAQRSAFVGGVTGAAIGGIAGRSLGGVVVGGAVGAGVGYLLGTHGYRCRKTSIFTGQRYIGTCYR